MNTYRLVFIIAVCIAVSGCTWLLGPAPTYTVTYDGNGNIVGTVPADVVISGTEVGDYFGRKVQ